MLGPSFERFEFILSLVRIDLLANLEGDTIKILEGNFSSWVGNEMRIPVTQREIEGRLFASRPPMAPSACFLIADEDKLTPICALRRLFRYVINAEKIPPHDEGDIETGVNIEAQGEYNKLVQKLLARETLLSVHGCGFHGCITYGAINRLVDRLMELGALTENSKFLDVGHGTGNVAAQVALRSNCRTTGIEHDPNRAFHAWFIQREFMACMPSVDLRMVLYHADIKDITDLCETTVLYAFDSVFSDEDKLQLARLFVNSYSCRWLICSHMIRPHWRRLMYGEAQKRGYVLRIVDTIALSMAGSSTTRSFYIFEKYRHRAVQPLGLWLSTPFSASPDSVNERIFPIRALYQLGRNNLVPWLEHQLTQSSLSPRS